VKIVHQVAVANSETDVPTISVRCSKSPILIPPSEPPVHLCQTFYDIVAPDLPKVTHPLEYARITYKVLYREYEGSFSLTFGICILIFSTFCRIICEG
jgi:hypothetical protein